ncbi:hypothetical protein BMS3Bbin06_00441 [bacterium BMS3Bbin06]|nr:hypothetical protein BMS3Bbin06_00441 [bacterium BMS3Bbin06]
MKAEDDAEGLFLCADLDPGRCLYMEKALLWRKKELFGRDDGAQKLEGHL